MSSIFDYTEILTLILKAIAENRVAARELLDMTDEQREAFVERLKAEEDAELERGKRLQEQSED